MRSSRALPAMLITALTALQARAMAAENVSAAIVPTAPQEVVATEKELPLRWRAQRCRRNR